MNILEKIIAVLSLSVTYGLIAKYASIDIAILCILIQFYLKFIEWDVK